MLRQTSEGGSWQVRVTLAGVARWLRSLGCVEVCSDAWLSPRADIRPYLESLNSGFGHLQAVRHSARFSRTPAAWDWPSMPPGTHAPRW